MNGLQKLTGFLALRRNTALLLMMLLLAGTGERLWLGFAPKYLQTLGASILIALVCSTRCRHCWARCTPIPAAG